MGKAVLGRRATRPGEKVGLAPRLLLVLLALPTGGAGPVPTWASPGSEPIVRRLEIRSDVELDDLRETRELIQVRAGKPLHRDAVQRSLRNLQAAGEAGEIEAYLAPLEDGVQVTFALWSKVWVEEVRLEGSLGLRPSRLRKVLPQGPDQPLVESRILRGLYQLEELYRSEGYFNAEVRLQVEVDERRKRAMVTYRIDSRQPATVARIEFEGDLGSVNGDRLREKLHAPAGNRFRDETVPSDAERLEGWLFEQGYRQAAVGLPRSEVDAEGREAILVYPISVGPRFELQIDGVAEGILAKNKLLPLQGRERFDEAALLQAEEALRTFYQERGHYRVQVLRSEERTGDLIRLRLTIDPGPVYQLEAIRLEGNEEVSSGVLEAVMATTARRKPFAGGGRLVDAVLAEDLDHLRSFYLLQGYSEVEIGAPEVESRGDRLVVKIPIREGTQQRAVQVAMVGTEALDAGALLRELPLRSGGPFHPRLLEESLARIRARYEGQGYESTQISPKLEWNAEGTRVDVTLRVLEGPQSTVDRVILRGNQRTRTAVVRRTADLQAGEPLNTSRLLEVQRNLYSLGIFSRVEVGRAPGTPYSGQRDVLIRLEEGARQRISYGLGYDSEDGVRALLGYTRGNLGGRGISGHFDIRASQREEQVRALLRQPYLGRWRLPTTYSLFNIEEERESFESERRGGQLEVQHLGENLRLGLLYTFKIVENSLEGIEETDIEPEFREVEISSLTPNLFLDYRDDPFDPTRGWNANLQFEYAFPAFGADTAFLDLFGQQTNYWNLGRFGVLAASLRLGAIEPAQGDFVDQTLPLPFESDEEFAFAKIPISERYFAGGRTTHRAYERDRLGVRCKTLLPSGPDEECDPKNPPDVPMDPVGGNGLLLASLDYRFPIVGPVGGTVFLDAGNVWADWSEFDPGEIKTGVGFGFRYLSPIGPLRLEAGWKLDREPGEDPFEVQFSFGNPF